MKRLFYILSFSLILFSCSKEENIPFKPAIEDTIDLKFYHNIEGKYSGVISDVTWINDTTYIAFNDKAHTIEIKELDFSFVQVYNISNKIESDAQAEMFRFSDNGGHMRFITSTMADSMGIDSVYYSEAHNEKVNCIYFYSGRMQYFINLVKNKDTIHQVFNYEKSN